MIDLTPLEVRKKKGDFRRQMRGYDPTLVDDFLDLVADRLEQVVRENLTMVERVTLLESQVSDYREREGALTDALVTAQQMREEMRRQVATENDLTRREAEQQAEHIRGSAVQAREREEEAIRRLRARQTQLLQSYRGFLERELAELQVISETLEVSRSIGLIADEPAPAAAARATQYSAPPAPTPTPPPPPPAVSAPVAPSAASAPSAPSAPSATSPGSIPLAPSMPSPPSALSSLTLRPDVSAMEKQDLPSEQLDVVDDIEDDGEADTGWVSTLIENKG